MSRRGRAWLYNLVPSPRPAPSSTHSPSLSSSSLSSPAPALRLSQSQPWHFKPASTAPLTPRLTTNHDVHQQRPLLPPLQHRPWTRGCRVLLCVLEARPDDARGHLRPRPALHPAHIAPRRVPMAETRVVREHVCAHDVAAMGEALSLCVFILLDVAVETAEQGTAQ